ncbi:MAG: thioredoxin [Anaerolineae bacterium]|nr:thioredoxin [Anaerolineae bacterium]
MYDQPIHVNDANFEKAVLQSPLPVLVDFWAPWCSPCRMVAPVLEQLAREYAGRLVVAKVNVDDDRLYASQYGVQGIPTLLFVKEGKVVESVVGFRPAAFLKERVEALLSAGTAP